MPAVSRAQRTAMAIAEHAPEKLNAANKGLANMSHDQLHDFASTPTAGLPAHVAKKPRTPSPRKKKHAAPPPQTFAMKAASRVMKHIAPEGTGRQSITAAGVTGAGVSGNGSTGKGDS